MTPTSPNDRAGMITGLFKSRDSAEDAYRCAADLGYEKSDINVLMSDDTRDRYFSGRAANTELASKAAQSADDTDSAADELGGPTGGTMGTLAPVLAAIGTVLLIPGLGIVAAGPVALALTAAGAVGVAGGLIGALTNWGIPKPRVEQYEAGIREGGVLIGVKPRSDEDRERLMQQWQASGGELIHS